jgi:uncharacterized membrane protein
MPDGLSDLANKNSEEWPMIRTPPGWGADMVTQAYRSMTTTQNAGNWEADRASGTPTVRRIDFDDLRWALARGWDDFGQSRTDVIFLCVMYPLVGLLLARLAFGYEMLPLLFPLASGFALLGPLAAVGLNELSRRRELGLSAGWSDAFQVFRSPSFTSIALLGLTLMMMFVFWLVLAELVYYLTLGPRPPASLGSFVHDVLFTPAGWAMAIIGVGIGFVFAVVTLSISVVSFPMLLDRHVPLDTAVRTSINVVRTNPIGMAAWGLILTTGLVIGSIPLLLGLIVVMPVLGHATWHLYRCVVKY